MIVISREQKSRKEKRSILYDYFDYKCPILCHLLHLELMQITNNCIMTYCMIIVIANELYPFFGRLQKFDFKI